MSDLLIMGAGFVSLWAIAASIDSGRDQYFLICIAAGLIAAACVVG